MKRKRIGWKQQYFNPNIINSYLLLECLVVFLLLSAIAALVWFQFNGLQWFILYLPILILQGLWFQRLYIVGHEAVHGKLFSNQRLNDFWGIVILIPLLIPLRIYRKIHRFHHTHNRRSPEHSALDVFTVRAELNYGRKIYYYALWYIAVFAGGFFIHGLVSMLLFMFIPVSISQRISPVFKDWQHKDHWISVLQWALAIGIHGCVFYWLGSAFYLYVLALPMIAFAWLWSMLLYIFHYDTSMGNSVQFNVRSLKTNRFFRWLFLNFNEHITHHQSPNIPWFKLPQNRLALPPTYAKNQNTHRLLFAILQQLRGPKIVVTD